MSWDFCGAAGPSTVQRQARLATVRVGPQQQGRRRGAARGWGWWPVTAVRVQESTCRMLLSGWFPLARSRGSLSSDLPRASVLSLELP